MWEADCSPEPSDLKMLELPPNIEQFTTAVEEDEVPAASDKARTLPQLRPSLFPNVPPFINFLALGEECDINITSRCPYLPVSRRAVQHPLAAPGHPLAPVGPLHQPPAAGRHDQGWVHQDTGQGGLLPTLCGGHLGQHRQQDQVRCWISICRNNTISDPRFVMLCKLTKDPVLATKLLSESGAGLDLLELNPEVSSSS